MDKDGEMVMPQRGYKKYLALTCRYSADTQHAKPVFIMTEFLFISDTSVVGCKRFHIISGNNFHVDVKSST